MELNNLKYTKGSMQTRNRVGRGIGSGNGKTSGRGQKGQNSRSGGGVRPGFEGGQNPLVFRIPKRGFNNKRFANNYTEVTLKMLNLATTTDVDAESLIKDNIISKANDGIVIIATGKLEKKLNVKAKRFTAKAKEQIEALGGKTEVI